MSHSSLPSDEPRGEACDAVADPRPTFDEVVERYGDKIYTTALHLTGNTEDAADLSQDVFERVYRNLDRYEPGTFDGWVYRITRNLFLDRMRRRTKLRMEPLPDEEWRVPATTEPGPADVVERATLEARLENGLAALAPDFRLAVTLCDLQGMTYDEISAVTGWPLGTVRSRIHRGRKSMRDYLASHLPYGDDEVADPTFRTTHGTSSD